MPTASELADLMRYDDYCARIYDDRRMPAGTRELALAMAWVLLRDPLYRRRSSTNTSGTLLWSRVECVLRRPHVAPEAGPVYRMVLREDAPRYESSRSTLSGRCVAPMIRRSGECGQSGMHRAIEYDPITGWETRVWWYCKRHSTLADQMRKQLGTTTRPKPIPNKGGLLPCYFAGDWAALYSWASPGIWRPPYHGLIADQWPRPGEDDVPRPPRLLVLPGGANHASS